MELQSLKYWPLFFQKNWRTKVFFAGPLIPLFLTSGDWRTKAFFVGPLMLLFLSSGDVSSGWADLFILGWGIYVLHVPRDSPLVWHRWMFYWLNYAFLAKIRTTWQLTASSDNSICIIHFITLKMIAQTIQVSRKHSSRIHTACLPAIYMFCSPPDVSNGSEVKWISLIRSPVMVTKCHLKGGLYPKWGRGVLPGAQYLV